MRAGFLDEVRRLHQRGDLSQELPSIRSVGYRQLWGYLSGESALEEAVRLGVTATRHLARRQLIWLRAMRDVRVFDSVEPTARGLIKASIAAHLAKDRRAIGS